MRPLRRALLAALVLGACLGPAPEGTLRGVVRDPLRGAPVADAELRIDGTERTARTDARGRFTLPAPAGAQSVTVSRPGYYTLERAEVLAVEGAPRDEDLALYPEDPSDDDVDRRLAALEVGRARRDSADDDDLRPEVRAYLRGERDDLPVTNQTLVPQGDLSQHSAALVGSCGASLPRPPATIRIWRRSLDGSTSSCRGRVDRIPFEDYVKGVLPHLGFGVG